MLLASNHSCCSNHLVSSRLCVVSFTSFGQWLEASVPKVWLCMKVICLGYLAASAAPSCLLNAHTSIFSHVSNPAFIAPSSHHCDAHHSSLVLLHSREKSSWKGGATTETWSFRPLTNSLSRNYSSLLLVKDHGALPAQVNWSHLLDPLYTFEILVFSDAASAVQH